MRVVVRSVSLLVASALVVAACAGKSTSHGGDGDDGGNGGTAGASGAGGTAAVGQGGTGALPGTGGAVITGGTNGTGGTAYQNPNCLLPFDSGSCDAIMYRFGFDPATGVCQEFFYGGCEGNANNFLTAADCYATCWTPGSTDLAGCGTSDQCVVTIPGCCGACEPVARHDLVAVNRTWQNAYTANTCTQGTTCGGCPPPTEEEPTSPWFGATCERGHCVVFDARETAATSCTLPSDCHLRQGLECCPGCAGGYDDLVAISNETILSGYVCGPETACDACISAPPPGVVTDCVDGRCIVDRNLR